jgi:uncharacterized protein
MLKDFKGDDGLTLTVRVVPRSSRVGVSFVQGGIRVRVTAAPVKGAATHQALKALAKFFHLSPSRVRCLRGESCRDKIIHLQGITRARADDLLSRLKDEGSE